MPGKVLVTSNIPRVGIEILEKECEVLQWTEDRPIPREVLLEKIRNVDGILCLLGDRIDREVFEHAPRLRVVSNYAAGYDNIDVEEATRRGVIVTNTPDVLTETTADITWALILSVARRVVEGDRFVREGRFRAWLPSLLLGTDVHGKTLGIIGAGRIGQAVGRRAVGFGMKILYHSRTRKEDFEKETGARFVSLEELLRESDFVSLHTPLTPETYHMIGEKEFRTMKKNAFFINTARGKCHDEEALVKALREGRIKGAGLDVYENEPEVHPELLEMDNVVLLPHIGSASVETREKMATMSAENLVAALRGERPRYVVNPEVFGDE